MKKAIIGMGANMGDKEGNIKKAIDALSHTPHIKFLRCSTLIETEPFGVTTVQDNYINCCIEIETDFSPQALLGVCLGIESAMGRERIYDKAPRPIDLDLLVFEGENINTNELIVPHPRILEREFVLISLRELYPNNIVIDFKI